MAGLHARTVLGWLLGKALRRRASRPQARPVETVAALYPNPVRPACVPAATRDDARVDIKPKPTRVPSAADVGASAEYTAFVDVSATAAGESASIWMRRVYNVEVAASGWHLMVEHDQFPVHSLAAVGGAVESVRQAANSVEKKFVDPAIGFFSAELGGDIFSETFNGTGEAPERWITRDPVKLGAIAGGINSVDHVLHRAVGMPLTDAVSARGAGPAAQRLVAGVGSNVILVPVDRQLAGLVQKIEIVGIAVGVAFGLHPLALACTKLFARAQLNHEIGHIMKRALFGERQSVNRDEKFVSEPSRPVDPSRAVESVRAVASAQARDEGVRAEGPRRGLLVSYAAGRNSPRIAAIREPYRHPTQDREERHGDRARHEPGEGIERGEDPPFGGRER
jgi:hypothetical protein